MKITILCETDLEGDTCIFRDENNNCKNNNLPHFDNFFTGMCRSIRGNERIGKRRVTISDRRSIK